MKIVLEQHGEEHTIKADGDEQTLDDMLDYFNRLLISAGYYFDGKVGLIE